MFVVKIFVSLCMDFRQLETTQNPKQLIIIKI